MTELDLGKTLKIEANGDIKIEKLIKIEAGAVYNDGGNVTVNVYGKEPMKEASERGQEVRERAEAEKGEAERADAACEEAEVMLAVEDEEMLLPMFKGDRENLRQFFAEVRGAKPEQIYNKINAWKGDGKMAKKFNVSKFHDVLKKMEIYIQSYQALNDNITK